MEVEWIILADSAQVVGNKLYLLGGGWDVLSSQRGLPFQQRCSVAVSIKVPWNETNQKHGFEIEMLSEDEQTEEPRSMMKAAGQFEVGRPAGIPSGQDQRVQLAMDMILKIESAGPKIVVARIDGAEARRTRFYVIAKQARPS